MIFTPVLLDKRAKASAIQDPSPQAVFVTKIVRHRGLRINSAVWVPARAHFVSLGRDDGDRLSVIARGGLFVNSAVIAEISGFMK